MSNKYIKQVQTALKQAGFYTMEVDGIPGKGTVSAVQNALAELADCKTAMRKAVAILDTNKKEEPVTGKYKLSAKSLERLDGVKPQLAEVIKLAITLSSRDFGVSEGLRTKERQAELVANGKSQTMNSKHITGDAVDLLAYNNGEASWELEHYYPLAEAVRSASKQLGVRVRWGGAWAVLNDTTTPAGELVDNYVASKKQQGKKPFIDAPHFELV